MFIDPAELNTVLYAYQVNQITDSNQDIVLQAIAAAVKEAKSYLTAYFDVDAIFAQTGTDRDPLLMEQVKAIAAYRILQLSNVDYLFSQAKDRYDRVIDWLKQVSKGLIQPDLPRRLDPSDPTTTTARFTWGSNQKFKY
jgi:phage gp36-like protein